MKDSIKCPICGKNGIPDFHKEDVVCPCCGVDLSIHHKLSDLSDKNAHKTKHSVRYRYLTSLTIILIFVLFAHITKRCRTTILHKEKQIEKLQIANDVLIDSIQYLNKKLDTAYLDRANTPKTKIYVVKDGDSFCKISKKLYGTEAKYIDILEWNNLNKNTVLHKGDTLKVLTK